MKQDDSYSVINTTLPPLKLNPSDLARSAGLSNRRAVWEMTLRPLFNNPMLTDEEFIICLRNVVAGLLRFERAFPLEGNQMLRLLKDFQNAKRKEFYRDRRKFCSRCFLPDRACQCKTS